MRVYVYIDAYNCIISFMLFLQEHLKNKRFYIMRKKIMNKMLSYLFVITRKCKNNCLQPSGLCKILAAL